MTAATKSIKTAIKKAGSSKTASVNINIVIDLRDLANAIGVTHAERLLDKCLAIATKKRTKMEVIPAKKTEKSKVDRTKAV